jgi:putative ABC transport system substrate-binding protein
VSLRRREFIAGIGGAAAWSLAAWAQQQPLPVIGVLNSGGPISAGSAFRRGLNELGYVEGRNVAFEIFGPTANTIGCRRRQQNLCGER